MTTLGSPVHEDCVELVQLAEKILSQTIKDGLVAYCPSMDLLAVATTDEQVQIFRLNGQRVVLIPARRGSEPTRLCWKPSGSLLAIAYSDNTISLIAAQGGKAVHQIQCPVPPTTKITAVGWGVSFTDVPGVHALLDADPLTSARKLTLDDVVHRGFIGEVTQPKLDLPSDLASLDVEDILPKLSVLPVGGKDGEVFTSRTSIDALFHSKDGKARSADVLLVGFEDGSAWLSVHDFFEVGRFDSKQVASGKGFSIVKHAYHPYSSTQTVLFTKKNSESNQDEVYFAPLDLKLIGENGRQFSLLASRSTQLLNVLRYVKETQVQLYNEFNASQTLPQRFVANAEEDLQEKENTNFKTAVYHLVATGDCSPVVKEWLVDQLGDRGQKRWEKAASSGYENTRRLMHENLLPALDRVNVLLSRLKGFALFQETAEAFGLDVLELDHALDTLKCLHLLGHTTLLASDTELRHSAAFCAWLKQEIDIQSTEHPPLNPDEADKEPNFDYADIFDYIEGPLQRSKLYDLFDIKHDSDERESVAMPSEADAMYEAYKSAMQRIRDGQILQKRLPGMAVLIERLSRQCSTVFGSIADTQQKKVRFGEMTPLGPCDLNKVDMRMVLSGPEDHLATYVSVVAKSGTQSKVCRTVLKASNAVSASTVSQQALMDAAPDGEIFDTKFVDDKTLCLGLKQGDRYRLLVVPYAGEETALSYATANERPGSAKEALELLDEQSLSSFTRHDFGQVVAKGAAPVKLEINGRKGRRAVCAVAEDGQHYRIFDVDSSTAVREEDEEDSMDMEQ